MNDLTVLIPAKNSAVTASLCLAQLRHQGIEGARIVYADNASIDGSWEMVQRQVVNNIHGLPIETYQLNAVPGGRETNIPYMRQSMTKMVSSPYLFWLDADVIVCPRSIAILYEAFKANPCGLLGIRYEPLSDHVTMGATLMTTAMAKQINWLIDNHCECKNAAQQLALLGLQSRYHDILTARHLKVI